MQIILLWWTKQILTLAQGPARIHISRDSSNLNLHKQTLLEELLSSISGIAPRHQVGV